MKDIRETLSISVPLKLFQNLKIYFFKKWTHFQAKAESFQQNTTQGNAKECPQGKKKKFQMR